MEAGGNTRGKGKMKERKIDKRKKTRKGRTRQVQQTTYKEERMKRVKKKRWSEKSTDEGKGYNRIKGSKGRIKKRSWQGREGVTGFSGDCKLPNGYVMPPCMGRTRHRWTTLLPHSKIKCSVPL